jgi:hypothetical protein
MRITRSAVNALVPVVLIVSCTPRSGSKTELPVAARQCAPAGRTIDSSFVAEQARSLLSRPGYSLRVDSFQTVSSRGVELGVLVSLVSSEPPVAGGGGLAWVDIETGCAIVLRRYE